MPLTNRIYPDEQFVRRAYGVRFEQPHLAICQRPSKRHTLLRVSARGAYGDIAEA